MATNNKNEQSQKLTIAETRKLVEDQKAEIQKLNEKIMKYEKTSKCPMCGRHKDTEEKFYYDTDPMLGGSSFTRICRDCARKIALRVDKNGEEHEPTKESVQKALFYLNKPYKESVWNSSVNESENLITGKVKNNVWNSYIKNIQMKQYVGEGYLDSDFFRERVIYDDEKTVENQISIEYIDDYEQNKKDVTKLLGYDPFEIEAISDQPFLYSQLLGLLDAGGEENDDMMRNSSCITIVRGFLQASKIDNSIAKLMSDINNIDKNSATIKSLQDSKQKIMSMITNLAAESCISLKNNKNAKKGENTWTGKTKKIKELDLREGRVNGFDMETCKAMRQVMDNSHHSILQELKLDESDWSDMVADQRDMIVNLQKQLDQYAEISRILLSENLDLKDFIKEYNIDTSHYSFVDLEELYSSFYAEDEEEGDTQNEDK